MNASFEILEFYCMHCLISHVEYFKVQVTLSCLSIEL